MASHRGCLRLYNVGTKTERLETDQPDISAVDRYFEITARGSSVQRELRGGLVTFFAMAYIIALNPLIIGTATDSRGLLISGVPKFTDEAMTQVDVAAVGASIGMVAAATALIAGLLTLLMGVVGRFPIGLATGLGLNALVAYALAPQMTWPQAMGLVVWEGIIIAILVLTGFRKAVFLAVPKSLRTAISVGIGLFIAFIGLMNAGVVRKPAGPTPVELGINGSLVGWPIFIFFVGLLVLVGLHVLRVKGAMLISILVATVSAVVVEAFAHLGPHIGVDNPEGWALNVPELGNFTAPDLSLLGRVDMLGAFFPDGQFSLPRFLALVVLVFSLLLADFFDTMGTVVAIGWPCVRRHRGRVPAGHLLEPGHQYGAFGGGRARTGFRRLPNDRPGGRRRLDQPRSGYSGLPDHHLDAVLVLDHHRHRHGLLGSRVREGHSWPRQAGAPVDVRGGGAVRDLLPAGPDLGANKLTTLSAGGRLRRTRVRLADHHYV